MSKEKVFKIGLCLAGSVSAGAYTAGVIDYLLEALEKWEAAKKNGENVPKHQVQITVIGGTSGGGMTGIVLASMLDQKIQHIRHDQVKVEERYPKNKLYHTWVDLTHNDMVPELLKTTDLNTGSIKSLLNSNFIEQIARQLVEPAKDKVDLPSYVSPDLKLFVTLSNLRGFNTWVRFRSDENTPQSDEESQASSKYYMQAHNDYACFQLSPKDEDKGWMYLNFENGSNVELAKNAAMATGAFPIGLRPIKLKRKAKYLKNNKWLNGYKEIQDLSNEEEVVTLNIDGGMINNEPFDRVKELMKIKTTTPDNFDSTVLMVDPFPSSKAGDLKEKGIDILYVALQTLGAMISQMRFKPQERQVFFEAHNLNQFLISPSRNKIKGEKAIACGSLAGFGGLIDKQFRIHDYFLGKHNCKRFLEKYFTVPESYLADNPIFKDGYLEVSNKDKFRGQQGFQIIPLIDTTDPFPNSEQRWPKISAAELKRLDGLLKPRLKLILKNYFNANSIILELAILILKLTRKTRKVIEKGLNDWNLIKKEIK